MRRLLLIRHAKSSWKYPELDDHERPLNRRGQRDVIRMARHLADKQEALDVIYSSTAIRALEFAQMVSELTHVTLLPDLSFYTFNADELLAVLQNLPEQAHQVAVVGHNPAITRVANYLSNACFDKVPTSGMVAINCHLDSWEMLAENCGELDYFDYPKMFESSVY